MLKNYEINNSTIAIEPIDNNTSRVIEESNIFIVNKNTTEIVNHSCKFFGSSFLGRREGTKALTGISYKAPIIIEETKSIIFFPTSSPRFDKCYWISLNHINDYVSKTGTSTLLLFKNGQNLNVNVSYGSLENQVLRATRLESILRHRKI
jgi:Genetic competence transcription factor